MGEGLRRQKIMDGNIIIKPEEIKQPSDLINKIVLGDCLETMKRMPDNFVDLVLTDPPYGIGADKGTMFTNKSGSEKGFTSFRNYARGNWDSKRPDKIYFEEIKRISKNQIIFGGNYFADYLLPSRCWIFWHKKGNNKTQGINFADGEFIYTSFDKNSRYIQFPWLGLDQINQPDEPSKQHPTQKPQNLIRKLLQDYSNENNLVYDPFMGSGTTARACIDLNRRFIGSEISPEYCKIAEQRLRQQVLI